MKLFLKLIVSFSILGIIFWQMGGIQDVFDLFLSINIVYVILILIFNTVDRALMTFKWIFLLQSKGIHLPLIQGMRIYCASMVWGIFLPSTIGADAIRALAISRLGFDFKEISVSILIERLVGFLSALALGALSLLLMTQISNLNQNFILALSITSLILLFSFACFIFSFSERLYDKIYDRLLKKISQNTVIKKIRSFHSAYIKYQDDKSTMILFFFLTFVEQLFPIAHSWLIALGMGIEVGILFFAAALPVAILVSRLPISIDGIGVFDGIFIFLMSMAGLSISESVAIAFAGRILQTISWLPWWLSFVFGEGFNLRSLKKEHSNAD